MISQYPAFVVPLWRIYPFFLRAAKIRSPCLMLTPMWEAISLAVICLFFFISRRASCSFIPTFGSGLPCRFFKVRRISPSIKSMKSPLLPFTEHRLMVSYKPVGWSKPCFQREDVRIRDIAYQYQLLPQPAYSAVAITERMDKCKFIVKYVALYDQMIVRFRQPLK